MITFNTELNSLVCLRHPSPKPMKKGQVTEKDGKIIEHYFCPKCYCTIPSTVELERKITAYRDARKLEEKKSWEGQKDEFAYDVLGNQPKKK